MVSKIDWEDRIGRRLKLRDLHVYFAVVQCGSMAKAAAQLGVSQPTVSEIIADLEHTFGVRLLDRVARGVEPTMYGNALLKRGIAAFDELKQSTRDIAFLADPTIGELKIGCAESIAAAVLPAIIERFAQQYPRVVVRVDDVPSTELTMLRERQHDLIVARMTKPLGDDDLNVETLFDDQMVVATDSRNPWARRRKIALAELIDEHWILSPPDTWAYLRWPGLPGTGARHAQGDFVTCRAPSQPFACQRAVHLGVSQIHRRLLRAKVLPVDLPVRPWPVVMVTLKNRTLSPIVERFLACARDVVRSAHPGPKTTSHSTSRRSWRGPQATTPMSRA